MVAFAQNENRRVAAGANGLPAVFVARGVTKVYRMGAIDVQALCGIDLDLYHGEFVVLLGPSGSGGLP